MEEQSPSKDWFTFYVVIAAIIAMKGKKSLN